MLIITALPCPFPFPQCPVPACSLEYTSLTSTLQTSLHPDIHLADFQPPGGLQDHSLAHLCLPELLIARLVARLTLHMSMLTSLSFPCIPCHRDCPLNLPNPEAASISHTSSPHPISHWALSHSLLELSCCLPPSQFPTGHPDHLNSLQPQGWSPPIPPTVGQGDPHLKRFRDSPLPRSLSPKSLP